MSGWQHYLLQSPNEILIRKSVTEIIYTRTAYISNSRLWNMQHLETFFEKQSMFPKAKNKLNGKIIRTDEFIVF